MCQRDLQSVENMEGKGKVLLLQHILSIIYVR